MYNLIADIFKYGLVLVVYMFIYSVIKLIYLDITDTRRMENSLVGAIAYLKTITIGKNQAPPFGRKKATSNIESI